MTPKEVKMAKLRRTLLPSLAGLSLALGLLLLVLSGLSRPTVAAPLARPRRTDILYHPRFYKGHQGREATLYLRNMGSLAANVTLTFRPVSPSGPTEAAYRIVPPRGILKLDADDVSQLPDHTAYSLIVEASEPVESVVEVYRSQDQGDRLAAYRGLTGDQVSTVRYFGPFHKATPHDVDTILQSTLAMWNPGGDAATVEATFLALDGTVAVSSTRILDPNEQVDWVSSAIEGLPNGFQGWVRVQADRPLTGLLIETSQPEGQVFELLGPLELNSTGGYTVTLPRALKAVDEGGGPRSTCLLVGNTGPKEANAELHFLREDGTLLHTWAFTLPVSGSATFDLGQEAAIPDGSICAALLLADQPLVMGEGTDFDALSSHSAAAYGTSGGTTVVLPRLVGRPGAHSAFSIVNLDGDSDATVSVDVYNLEGHLVLTKAVTLGSRLSHRYDLRDLSGLGDAFEGGATLNADRPVMAWVDRYDRRTCWARVAGSSVDYAAVQEAVDAAAPGDTVKVAGTCSGVEARGGAFQTVYLDKSITLRGGYTTTNWTTADPLTHPTTLDAQGEGRVIYISGPCEPTVEGFDVTGGDATGLGGTPNGGDAGGGLLVSAADAVISNNRVFGNAAAEGGGVYLRSSGGMLRDNVVSTNTHGGIALFSGDALLHANAVQGNGGGGVFLYVSESTVDDNLIASNAGRGLSLFGSGATISGNIVVDNADRGFDLTGSDAALKGNVISSNANGGLSFYRSDAVLINNIVAGNQMDTARGALDIVASSPRLVHNTIAHNTGGDGVGVYVGDFAGTYATALLTNTILVSHTVGISVPTGNTAALDATLWHGNGTDWAGGGTINTVRDRGGWPAFVDPIGGNFHIGPDSAALDQGVAAGVMTDVDGHQRPQGGGYDIGADEYASAHIYLPLVLRQ
jgi:parallel beta-helix repeat protein